MKTFIIAEAGVNHNGELDMALELVREAKKAGADCVKFQTFKADRVVTKNAPKAAYQLLTTPASESQIEMLAKLELSGADYIDIMELCDKEEILFLSTAYNIEDADFLDKLNVPSFKIASGQIIELLFLQHVARKGKPIILSTGMATLAEVDEAVRAIRGAGNNDIVLLQCTTNYPSRVEDANLRVIPTLRDSFDVKVGYSDHTQSSTACIAAVALGAQVIEKHFTLDKSLPGPDHSSSADPEEFAGLVRLIRETEAVLGSSLKEPTEIEKQNAVGMRRSIVAKEFIPAGSRITEEMITFKRPATGINPSLISEVIGSKAKYDIAPDTMISWNDIEK